MRRLLTLVVVSLLLAALGCGGDPPKGTHGGKDKPIPADKKDSIIANTALAGPGETVEVTFKVPAKAGSYNFLCSFPGHYALGMRGKLIVK